MRCKESDPNPATCLAKGEEVHACVIGVERTMRKVGLGGGGGRGVEGCGREVCGGEVLSASVVARVARLRVCRCRSFQQTHSVGHPERPCAQSCKEPWNNYAQCLWKNNNEFKKCRSQQEALEAAWAEVKAGGK